MSTIDGFYVSVTGKTISVTGMHTINPKIVDLSEHNLGLVVVGQEFFEDETDAKEQAKFNAEDTIAECEELLESLKKPARKSTNSKSGITTKFNWGRTKKSEDDDPLGPPDFGVGRQLKHIKGRYYATVQGYREDKNEEVSYMLKTEGGKVIWLSRKNLDNQFEVVE